MEEKLKGGMMKENKLMQWNDGVMIEVGEGNMDLDEIEDEEYGGEIEDICLRHIVVLKWNIYEANKDEKYISLNGRRKEMNWICCLFKLNGNEAVI